MLNITEALEKFNHLTTALDQEVDVFLAPYQAALPDARLRPTLRFLLPGMLAARSPHLSKAAAHAPHWKGSTWALTKQFYTLLYSTQFTHHNWLHVLYAQAVALDLEWITRARSKRLIEVYRPQQADWQAQELQSWIQSLDQMECPRLQLQRTELFRTSQ